MNFAEFTDLRARWETDGYQMMTREMVERFDSFFADKTAAAEYKSEGFYRAQAGDFSRFETVEPMMKGYLGAKNALNCMINTMEILRIQICRKRLKIV